jgi:hypothetical protein
MAEKVYCSQILSSISSTFIYVHTCLYTCIYIYLVFGSTAPVVQWSGFLATDPEARVRFPKLPDFLRSSVSRECHCGLVVRVLGYRSGGPGSIPGTARKNK